MEKLLFNEAQKIWTEIAQHKTPGELQLEVELYKKLLNIFQVGDYYYFIFNPPEMKIEFASESLGDILGYDPQEFTLECLFEAIHAEDLPFFMDFEATVTNFWNQLPVEKVLKYKSRYDYRIRKKDGSYLRILQQIITIQSDDDGAVLRTFVVHTDISDLKQDSRMVLSFIGLDGEPSYIDVKPVQKFSPTKSIFTKREKDIVHCLSQGKTTTEIAETLHISPLTVSTHRKNILRKTGASSVFQLIKLTIEKGWL